jgi:hypothetical protein
MTHIYTISSDCDYYPSCSTFIPCCNVPVQTNYQQRHFQEIYYAPEPPPQIQVIRQRLPEPPPDVIDRVVVVPQPKKYVYQVVEVPSKPPPVIQQRFVHEAPNTPLCGGTYRVPVAPNSNAQTPRLVQSSSNVQVSPSYVQASPSFVQASPSFVQASPSFVQASPSYTY